MLEEGLDVPDCNLVFRIGTRYFLSFTGFGESYLCSIVLCCNALYSIEQVVLKISKCCVEMSPRSPAGISSVTTHKGRGRKEAL